MNNKDFASYCKSKVGCYYWFGTFGQKASKALYNEKKKQYPNQYTASDFDKQIANPKQCFDCAGLPKSIILLNHYSASDDLGATGIYGKCKKKGKITSFSSLKEGTLVFKGNDSTKSHVGVYVGDNTIIEAKGHKWGVVSSACSDSFKYWAEYYAVDYEDQPAPEPVPGDRMIVTTQYTELMLRAYASTSAPILQRMKKGWKVTFLGDRTEDSKYIWVKVRCNNIVGYACEREKSKSYNYLTFV